MEAQGVIVNRLLRISYGPFQLGQLKPGAVEELKQRVVRDQLGLRKTPKAPSKRKTPPKGAKKTRTRGNSTRS